MTALAGCGESETPAQLQAWIAAARDKAATTQTQTTTSSAVAPLSYRPETGRAPFDRNQTDDPDIARSRPAQRGNVQPLEEFSVDSIQMVGTISQAGRRHVLLQAEQIVYLAKTGDYLGKNFGMIRRIADSEIEIEELVPATEGRWTPRLTMLPLRGERK